MRGAVALLVCVLSLSGSPALARGLSNFADTATRRALEVLHSQQSPGVRANAARRLGRMCNRPALDGLQGAALNDRSVTVRAAARGALSVLEQHCALEPPCPASRRNARGVCR